jgi:plastocyanin
MRVITRFSLAATLLLAPLLAGSVAAAEFAVDIQGMKFVPAQLSVAPGDTITFTNRDAAPHTATANDGSFDTGRLARGQSATVTIGAAGTFNYICALHPAMKGVVTAQ